MDDEALIRCQEAAKRIGVSTMYLRAVLKAMGKEGLRFFDKKTVQEVKSWIVANPKFRMKTGLSA